MYKNSFSNPTRTTLKYVINWRKDQTVLLKVVLALVLACLTGIFAQLKFFLPWTPIPVTLQSVTVLSSGILLGPIFGGLSQAIYLLFGILGVNWFANRSGGIEAILGPTGGYLVGFIIASFIVGLFSERIFEKNNAGIILFMTLLLVNFTVIYGIGLIQLFIWYKITQGTILSLGVLLLKGAFPFIIGDLIKIVGITMVVSQ